MSSHRIQCPGPPQPWHPDAGSVSAPRLDYLQVFYYPSGATREMGPTELIPGSHLSQARNAFLGRLRSLKPAVSTASPPGSIIITAYSIVHRRSPSTATGVRDNLKYNYWRTTPPQRDWVVDPDFNFSWHQERAAALQCFRRPDVRLALRGGLGAHGRPGLALLHRGRLRLRPDRSAQGPAPRPGGIVNSAFVVLLRVGETSLPQSVGKGSATAPAPASHQRGPALRSLPEQHPYHAIG